MSSPMSSPRTRRRHTIEEARSFVHRVKRRFTTTPFLYDRFVETLLLYPKGSGVEAIKAQIKPILQYHPDLLDEFYTYALSDSTCAPSDSKGGKENVEAEKKEMSDTDSSDSAAL